MTCREKLMREHPEEVNSREVGGCANCPHHYGYAHKPEWCDLGKDTCTKCWDREIEIRRRIRKL